ncbi:MAG: SDR family oxidoreductase [Candidatus Methylacidiphilales bacterium]
MKILVTGASGQFGTATIHFLLNKIPANDIIALVKDEQKATDLRTKGIEIKVGNYDDYASLINAMKGVDKVLLISGNEMTKRQKQHNNVINAAKECGVKHLVYTSFLRKNETKTSPLGAFSKSHIETEKAIIESGITYTIMLNSLYADILPMFFGPQVLEAGIFLPTEDGMAAYATKSNMAEAAANILTGIGHENKKYIIANTENYSMDDAAEILSEIKGEEVEYASPTNKDYVEALVNAGFPQQMANSLVGFCEAIKQGEFETETTDLEVLLGRKPTSLNEYFETIYSK